MLINNFSMLCGKNRATITDISKATGISRTTLTSIYYDRAKSITFEVLDKLCIYFNCSLNDIIEYKKDVDFCIECREDVEYDVVKEMCTSDINGTKLEHRVYEARCTQCGEKMYIPELYDENSKEVRYAMKKAGIGTEGFIEKIKEETNE